ncbi:ATP-dependent DNA helicase pif1-like [Bactrocera dorsalis]|uniref:ATP-dependent DNA helicase n=1 Tax=Bactrocera dorsalis TaxID=27457 RepID=A0ABM3K4W6_BACDO|nr:ATP-dependent DNA helicase pif1-like [Bactrocera dorsalis]XP_049316520.1 ATP-dependent DNA helicase pif1-like [Bactrocera dorsalis]XP_049316521.1 ATP-dependent DNA helicase pif1-like [Bactrocera dorsalis]
MCLKIAHKALSQLSMISPDRPMHDLMDQELQREQQFHCDELIEFVQSNIDKLNDQQNYVYQTILQAVSDNTGGIYFLDAPGGTGKTFIITLILAAIRSQKKIALALASSGIAGTLLDGGRTAHSALKLPLNMQVSETPTCNISRNSAMGKVLKQAAIILWNECTMANKKSLDALDRTMKDLHGNQQLFGGALILLSGDFRQTLPIHPRSTPADEINACMKSSALWRFVKKLTLNVNMRVLLQDDSSAHQFSEQLLDIGNGKMQIDNTNGMITLPENFCTILQTKEELVECVFPNIIQNHRSHDWLAERSILAPKNIHVNAMNFQIQEKLPGEVITYKSIDSVMDEDDAVNYPIEFLNSLEPPGTPPHLLNLKVGLPTILLRNINPPKMCNGTRLVTKKLMPNLIEASILNGKAKGENVLIPRIPMIPTDMPFNFKRLQFPVRLSFAMTINKAQGQTFQICGVNLEESCFSRGQLYVACSRVATAHRLFIHAPDSKTKNVVYQNVLD